MTPYAVTLGVMVWVALSRRGADEAPGALGGPMCGRKKMTLKAWVYDEPRDLEVARFARLPRSEDQRGGIDRQATTATSTTIPPARARRRARARWWRRSTASTTKSARSACASMHVKSVRHPDGSGDLRGIPAARRRTFPLHVGEIPNADAHALEGSAWTEWVTRGRNNGKPKRGQQAAHLGLLYHRPRLPAAQPAASRDPRARRRLHQAAAGAQHRLRRQQPQLPRDRAARHGCAALFLPHWSSAAALAMVSCTSGW